MESFVNLESVSLKLGSENTKMYLKLLSDILTNYVHKHVYYYTYMIVQLHCEYGINILVFLEHTWKSKDTYKWIAVREL